MGTAVSAIPMPPPKPRRNALIRDAHCPRDGAPVESSSCRTVPGVCLCPVGVCRHCGATWRRVDHLPLCAAGAGSRDFAEAPDLTPLRMLAP
jgi:hypothetical protein